MVTKAKAVEAARLFSRSKVRFKTAALAWQDIKKRSGLTGKAVPDHSESAWRFRLGSSDEAPKTSSAKVAEKPKAKSRRSAPNNGRAVARSESGQSSPAVAVALAAVGLGGLLVFRYRSELKTRFLQAKRSRVRRSKALPTAVVPLHVPAAVGERSPFRLPTGGGELFNANPGSFEFPEDITFQTGDGFDIRIRPPIAETGEIVAHTSI